MYICGRFLLGKGVTSFYPEIILWFQVSDDQNLLNVALLLNIANLFPKFLYFLLLSP
jgi:hypothetical protein